MREEIEVEYEIEPRCPDCLRLLNMIGIVKDTTIPVYECPNCNKVFLVISSSYLVEIKYPSLKYLAAKL